MNEEIKHIGVRVTPDVYHKMRYIAEYEGRTINGHIRYLLQQSIREFEKEHGAITAEELEHGHS